MKSVLLSIFFLFCLRLLPAQPIIHVTPTGAGTRTGDSWANALSGTDLPGKLPAALPGTQFWLAAGTYKPTTTTDRTASFSITSGISVYGGFAGTEMSIGQRNPNSKETILSGNIGESIADSDNSRIVVRVKGADGNVTLDRLTIQDGHVANEDRDYDVNVGPTAISGSGLSVTFAKPLKLIITTCRFIRNNGAQGFGEGGAIGLASYVSYVKKFSFRISDCEFLDNSALDGGAIYKAGSISDAETPSIIERCSFIRNSSVGSAGAIYNVSQDTLPIRHCRFIGNYANGSAGALFAGFGRCIVENCLFDNNRSGNYGGAVEGMSSRNSYYNCEFANNKAKYGAAVSKNVFGN